MLNNGTYLTPGLTCTPEDVMISTNQRLRKEENKWMNEIEGSVS